MLGLVAFFTGALICDASMYFAFRNVGFMSDVGTVVAATIAAGCVIGIFLTLAGKMEPLYVEVVREPQAQQRRATTKPAPARSAQMADESEDSPEGALAEEKLAEAELELLREAGNKNMFIGGVWCFGGTLVTLYTYMSASGGGTYVVAWGAILFGGVQFLKGLSQYSRG